MNKINTRDISENPEDAGPEVNPDFYLTGDVAPEGMYLINTALRSVCGFVLIPFLSPLLQQGALSVFDTDFTYFILAFAVKVEAKFV